MTDSDPGLLAERESRLEAPGPRPPWWRVFARRSWRRRHAEILAMDVSQYAAWLREVYGLASVAEMVGRPPAWGALRKAKGTWSYVVPVVPERARIGEDLASAANLDNHLLTKIVRRSPR